MFKISVIRISNLFRISSLEFRISRASQALSFMQNKAKVKIGNMYLTHYTKSTYKGFYPKCREKTNPKQSQTNPILRGYFMFQTLEFRISNLFRVSDLVLRISGALRAPFLCKTNPIFALSSQKIRIPRKNEPNRTQNEPNFARRLAGESG